MDITPPLDKAVVKPHVAPCSVLELPASVLRCVMQFCYSSELMVLKLVCKKVNVHACEVLAFGKISWTPSSQAQAAPTPSTSGGSRLSELKATFEAVNKKIAELDNHVEDVVPGSDDDEDDAAGYDAAESLKDLHLAMAQMKDTLMEIADKRTQAVQAATEARSDAVEKHACASTMLSHSLAEGAALREELERLKAERRQAQAGDPC
eukprot:NODE_6126_length_877_cov_83.336870_g5895_i0.p1 GENE.NODE_6126_length_877_cov_83.336870_g5895_i0~~NODE_6126_length_877_cov_83.336870_g5895_i0.p1  ORF type:complete len:207 (+),score=48.08 NODE_6126_length_877_cov_83.336870_g5895_i0:74-694(+)